MRKEHPSSDEDESTPGTVYLVGSGPGDPDLLTMKARRLLDTADVVLHDSLPGPEIIESIPPDRREDVGKRAGGEWTPQEYTNRRLVELAREGKTVVRLKGGDPFVFGRGGEEMEYLAEAAVPFEVVPGITSAIAGPGVAGIPVTHREHASSVSFVTGHEDPTKDESAIDWAALAATGGTLVVLMGVGKLPLYTGELLDAGMDPATPVALIERATWPDMRVATGTLESIVDVCEEAGIEPPALTVIGTVAGTRERVRRFIRNTELAGETTPEESGDDRPTVAVFRPDDERIDRAAETLAAAGVDPVADPMLEIDPTGALPESGATYLLVTSKTGVELLAEAGWEPTDETVCCIGPQTAKAAEAAGWTVDLVPETYTSSGLVDLLADRVEGEPVEIARSDHGSDVLVDGLVDAGAIVNETVLYRLERPADAGDSVELAAAGALDGAAFTSSLTVEHFVDAATERGLRAAAIDGLNEGVVGAIGPPTRETAAAAGIDVDVVPKEATFEALAAAVVRAIEDEQ
ncbi:MAG: uroporphyrinogen-III synthase [Halobacteriota archaeon]